MACEKKLSRVLLVRVLPSDGSSEMSSWLGWQESLMIFRAFLTHRWVVDVLEGGKLTSDDVLGRLNYFLQGSSRIRWWCSQSGCSTQCNCRTVWGFLSSDQISPVAWGRRDAVGLPHYWLCVSSPGEVPVPVSTSTCKHAGAERKSDLICREVGGGGTCKHPGRGSNSGLESVFHMCCMICAGRILVRSS